MNAAQGHRESALRIRWLSVNPRLTAQSIRTLVYPKSQVCIVSPKRSPNRPPHPSRRPESLHHPLGPLPAYSSLDKPVIVG